MKAIECVGAIIGVMLVGCAWGMLFAPRSGEQTRADIKRFFDDELEKYHGKCRCISEKLKEEVDDIKQAVAAEMAK